MGLKRRGWGLSVECMQFVEGCCGDAKELAGHDGLAVEARGLIPLGSKRVGVGN